MTTKALPNMKQRYDEERTRRQFNLSIREMIQKCKAAVEEPNRELHHNDTAIGWAKRCFEKAGDLQAFEAAEKAARRQHTPLHEAVIRSDLNAVRALLNEHKGDNDFLQMGTVSGLTALHLAVYAFGRIQIGPHWDQLVRTAEKSVQERIVDLLIERGARVDLIDDQGRLPAACLDGARSPRSLRERMEEVRLASRWFAAQDDDAMEYSVFYSPTDGRSPDLMRGNPGGRRLENASAS